MNMDLSYISVKLIFSYCKKKVIVIGLIRRSKDESKNKGKHV